MRTGLRDSGPSATGIKSHVYKTLSLSYLPSHPFVIRTLSKLPIHGNSLSLIFRKSSKTPTANLILHGEVLDTFLSTVSNKATQLLPIQHDAPRPSDSG